MKERVDTRSAVPSAVGATVVDPLGDPNDDSPGHVSMKEQELLLRAQAGDKAALVTLLEEQFAYVTGVCLRVLRDPVDAEDARQLALMQVARQIVRFEGRSAFRTWVHRIAVNCALDVLHQRQRHPVSAHDWEIGSQVSVTVDPSLRLDVDAALAQIEEPFRTAVVLRDLCDLEYDEIATRMQVPIGTVRSRISRGRNQLAMLLGSYEPSGETPR